MGAILAERDQCDSLIFHDVDLLPSDDLGSGLRRVAIGRQAPAHRAGLGPLQRQQGLFRGCLRLDHNDFARINGFPNNFWGWGGEDDEMMAARACLGRVLPWRHLPTVLWKIWRPCLLMKK